MVKQFISKYSIIIVILVIFILGWNSGISYQELLYNIGKLTFFQASIIIIWFLVIASLSIIGKKVILSYFGHPIKTKNIILIHFASISAHYSTPAKIGYPVSIYLLKKLENIPVTISTASIIMELFVSVFITAVVGLVGSILYFREQFQSLSNLLLIVLLVIAIIFVVFIVLYSNSQKLQDYLVELKAAIKLLTIKNFIIYFTLQLFVQFAVTIHVIMITYFLGSEISFWYAMVSYSAAFIIGAVSMVPMGIGTRDVSMVYYLTGFGLPSDIAVIIVAIQRVITTGIGYLLGLIASSIIGLKSFRDINK